MHRLCAVCAALVLAAVATAQRRIDPPAADASPAAFFLKAAEHRPAPPGLAKAAASALVRAARFLMSDAGIDNNAIRDESGRKAPPYLYHAVIDDDNRPVGLVDVQDLVRLRVVE